MTTLQDSFKNLSIDSVLVSQKDELLHQINNAGLSFTGKDGYDKGYAELRAILFSLSILKDLWVSQSYGYKFNELIVRVRTVATSLISILEDQSYNSPKQVRRMKQIIKICDDLMVPQELRIL